jgi:hypothetical protein
MGRVGREGDLDVWRIEERRDRIDVPSPGGDASNRAGAPAPMSEKLAPCIIAPCSRFSPLTMSS